MADRYWVGGSANWDGLALLKWSTSSGGLGGASVPTTADDVFFDNLSTGNCIISTGNTGAKSINCTGFAGTISGTAGITVAGSVTLVASMTYTYSGVITITGTGTLTTAGKSLSNITINGSGITVTLGNALIANTITLSQGTFNANIYNVTAARFLSNTSAIRTLTMGSGLWTLSAASTGTTLAPWNTATTTNLTFNKNTANILLSNNTATTRSFFGGSLAYNKLTIGGNTGTSICRIENASSFTELASTKTVAHTVRFVTSSPTIDTWSITGSSGNVVTVDTVTAGSRRTFNLSNVTSGIDYLSVRDIGVNQANRFYVGVNSTDGGNNLNVIFTAPPSIGYTITAVNGTYLVSGQNATLSFGRLLSAQNGVYSVAGQAVDISVGAPPAPTLGIELFVEIRSFTERRRF